MFLWVLVLVLQECMLAIGQKKAVTLEAVRSVKFIFKQFHLNALTVRPGEREIEREGDTEGKMERERGRERERERGRVYRALYI